MVVMPRRSASLGLWMTTVRPCHRMWSASGAHRPATVLINDDFPAPLSPTSAVTCPAGTSRSTPSRARTAPKLLDTPRSCRSGGAVPPVPPVPSVPPVPPSGSPFMGSSGCDAGGLAVGGVVAGAELCGGDEVVLDDGCLQVLGGHPLGLQQHRRDGDVGGGVLGGPGDQPLGGLLPGP